VKKVVVDSLHERYRLDVHDGRRLGHRSPRLDGVTVIEAAHRRRATGRAGRRIKRGAHVTDRFGFAVRIQRASTQADVGGR